MAMPFVYGVLILFKDIQGWNRKQGGYEVYKDSK